MANYCCYEDCVEDSFVATTCPMEYASFLKSIDEDEIDIGGVADLIHNHESEEINPDVEIAFEALCSQFEKTTGLVLGMAYHSAEDRADDLDGHVFTVGNVYVPSDAGKKYAGHIVRKHWTIFG